MSVGEVERNLVQNRMEHSNRLEPRDVVGIRLDLDEQLSEPGDVIAEMEPADQGGAIYAERLSTSSNSRAAGSARVATRRAPRSPSPPTSDCARARATE